MIDYQNPSTKPTKYGRCDKCNYALSSIGGCGNCYRVWQYSHCGCGAEKIEVECGECHVESDVCAGCRLIPDRCFCDMP